MKYDAQNLFTASVSNVMPTTISDFFSALNDEELAFLPALYADRKGLIVKCAVSELDWFSYNIRRQGEPTDEQLEQFYILNLGTTRLIHLALKSEPSYELDAVTFARNRELTSHVLTIVSALGIIQHGRRVAQGVALGYATVEEVEAGSFVFTLRDQVSDVEYYERVVRDHYALELRRLISKQSKSEKWSEAERQVESKLQDLVYTFQKKFIGYGADPLLDDHFFALADQELRFHDGFDSFHFALDFGGVRYQHYVLGLTFMLAIAIRHERFAEALVRKNAEVRLEDVLTVSADPRDMVGSLAEAVNRFGSEFDDFQELSLDGARTVFRVLACQHSSSALLEAPGSPMPMLVQTGDKGVITQQSVS